MACSQLCLQWILGLVDETMEPHALLRHRFRSKIGGRPVRVCSYCALPGNCPTVICHLSLLSFLARRGWTLCACLHPKRLPASRTAARSSFSCRLHEHALA